MSSLKLAFVGLFCVALAASGIFIYFLQKVNILFKIFTSNEEKTSGQLLEDDNPLALVDAGQNNGDDTGGQAGSQRTGVLAEEVLGGSRLGTKSEKITITMCSDG